MIILGHPCDRPGPMCQRIKYAVCGTGFMNKDTDGVGDAGVQRVNDVLQFVLQAWCLEQILLGDVQRYGTLKTVSPNASASS